jgi:hypothetical protein
VSSANDYELVFGRLGVDPDLLSPKEQLWAARVLLWSSIARIVAAHALRLVILVAITVQVVTATV